MSDTEERLTEYCLHGGLYNPELMQQDKVRELLIDCRDEIERLRLTDEDREAIAGVAAVLHRLSETGVGHGACLKLAEQVSTLRNLLERLHT